MITPDVVLYFCGVHSSHVHKYLNLNKKLNEKCNAILILDNGKWGVSKDHLEKFKKEDLENVYHLNYNDALTALNSLKYKLAVLSSNFRKGTIESRDCQIAKSKGAKTLQVSEMNIDFYYSGADYVSLISENFEKRTSLSSTLKVLDDQKLFSNCFLWDNIEDCLPYTLTKDAFCKKYGLNPNENILMWGPDSIQCQHEGAQIAYRAACNLKNVIVKKVMTVNPISIEKDELAAKALSIMNNKKITSLCVHKKESKNKTIGILHIHNILEANVN